MRGIIQQESEAARETFNHTNPVQLAPNAEDEERALMEKIRNKEEEKLEQERIEEEERIAMWEAQRLKEENEERERIEREFAEAEVRLAAEEAERQRFEAEQYQNMLAGDREEQCIQDELRAEEEWLVPEEEKRSECGVSRLAEQDRLEAEHLEAEARRKIQEELAAQAAVEKDRKKQEKRNKREKEKAEKTAEKARLEREKQEREARETRREEERLEANRLAAIEERHRAKAEKAYLKKEARIGKETKEMWSTSW
ncbi:hypothetical protein M408DRAFT_173688 [Serendipita vermifera MAFF 305830]|uniref:Uncharacterized protein n=1 Tax=Serendipita vermifera MAFF 305830 TaxID=933852 RepID=A0A0C3B4M4_SERVB|nr:hypothetical protein M408DRAFT_173688 [Serendipita vermifera MAFF 305830]